MNTICTQLLSLSCRRTGANTETIIITISLGVFIHLWAEICNGLNYYIIEWPDYSKQVSVMQEENVFFFFFNISLNALGEYLCVWMYDAQAWSGFYN